MWDGVELGINRTVYKVLGKNTAHTKYNTYYYLLYRVSWHNLIKFVVGECVGMPTCVEGALLYSTCLHHTRRK